MKITRIAGAALALACLGAWAVAPAQAQVQSKSVAVTAIVEHPALDAVRDGVRDELAEQGWKPGDTLRFDYQSAQGNPGTAVQIARQFVGQAPDVIVPISTPSAQAVVSAARDIPVVFTAVTDPLGAQLVRDLSKPGRNVTGLSDLSPVADHLALIREIMPDAKRLGFPYNPGEPNSVTLLELVKKLAPDHGFSIVEAPATRSADVQGAARGLVGRVDAVYMPTDNTVVSALEALLIVGAQNKLPVFTADTDSVQRGAVATVGFNYYQVGRQTGQIVARVLKGENPGDIPVKSAEGTDLYVNPKAAAAMGITIPEGVLARASKVVGQ
ncbi:ABC transporter substrate-binding protein [Skermanella sp. TT6]|uniref:ABC transporter substrate-binding protein n=1 Tax=Skermanella cutis TaxID=2775420 RepID=A0ABX7B7P4_9PROT|nr:ABC transporter substrate-binding protein [Skermanella sp. TT6]QQP90384.1 ABC transporter substrate-binding protein [Skermanella sp. TT6]